MQDWFAEEYWEDFVCQNPAIHGSIPESPQVSPQLPPMYNMNKGKIYVKICKPGMLFQRNNGLRILWRFYLVFAGPRQAALHLSLTFFIFSAYVNLSCYQESFGRGVHWRQARSRNERSRIPRILCHIKNLQIHYFWLSKDSMATSLTSQVL